MERKVLCLFSLKGDWKLKSLTIINVHMHVHILSCAHRACKSHNWVAIICQFNGHFRWQASEYVNGYKLENSNK